jgi:hypothetical protein
VAEGGAAVGGCEFGVRGLGFCPWHANELTYPSCCRFTYWLQILTL